MASFNNLQLLLGVKQDWLTTGLAFSLTAIAGRREHLEVALQRMADLRNVGGNLFNRRSTMVGKAFMVLR